MEIEERIALLEAKVELQKEVIHALVSLLPMDPRVNGPLQAAVRMFNQRSRDLSPEIQALRKVAYTDLDPNPVRMLGVLALK